MMNLRDSKNPPCDGVLQPTGSAAYQYYEKEYSTPPRTNIPSSYHHHNGYNNSPAYEDEFHYHRPTSYSYRYHSYWEYPHHRGESMRGPRPETGIQERPPTQTYNLIDPSDPSSTYASNRDLSPWPPSGSIPSPSCYAPPASVTPTKKSAQKDSKEDARREHQEPDNLILELQDHDIVCGRGAPVNWQKGNEFFRDLIAEHQTEYLCSKRCDKPKIATEVMGIIKSNGGRFVRRVKASYRGRFGWEEIAEKRAYEKVCQALREGAPELRRKMLASSGQLRLHLDEFATAQNKENL